MIFSFSVKLMERKFFLKSPTSRTDLFLLFKNLRPHKQCSWPSHVSECISTLTTLSNRSLVLFRTQSDSKSDWNPFLNLNPHLQLLNQISSSALLSISTNVPMNWSSYGGRLCTGKLFYLGPPYPECLNDSRLK